jgi:hypothetical protein
MPKTLATAAVDRLLNHAHVVVTEGTSLRLTDATTGKGVMPLTLPRREISCPPAGRSPVRGQGHRLTAHREVELSVDRFRNE